MKKKIPFIIGLGQKASEYRHLSKYFNIIRPDWNNGSLAKLKLGKPEILVGFSMGAVVAVDHALKHRVKHLILCSLTPGVETLKGIKADRIDFIIGDREDWVEEDALRLTKTLKKDWNITYVPNTGHKVTSKYLQELRLIINIGHFTSER